LLTYTLSEPIPSYSFNIKRTSKVSKFNERHKLSFKKIDNSTVDDFKNQEASKTIRKIEGSRDRVIPIGLVTFKSNF
jgi:hypothetical protein